MRECERFIRSPPSQKRTCTQFGQLSIGASLVQGFFGFRDRFGAHLIVGLFFFFFARRVTGWRKQLEQRPFSDERDERKQKQIGSAVD